jgi:hypothetical protein
MRQLLVFYLLFDCLQQLFRSKARDSVRSQSKAIIPVTNGCAIVPQYITQYKGRDVEVRHGSGTRADS